MPDRVARLLLFRTQQRPDKFTTSYCHHPLALQNGDENYRIFR